MTKKCLLDPEEVHVQQNLILTFSNTLSATSPGIQFSTYWFRFRRYSEDIMDTKHLKGIFHYALNIKITLNLLYRWGGDKIIKIERLMFSQYDSQTNSKVTEIETVEKNDAH